MNWLRIVTGFAKRHSPEILTAMAVGGTGASAYFVAKATYKATPIIDNMKAAGAPGKEIFKKVAPLYAASGVSLASTVACIIGARVAGAQQVAAMSTLLASSQAAAKEVWNQVEQRYGTDAVQEIKNDIATAKMNAIPTTENQIINTGHGDTLFCDLFSGRYFRSSIECVKQAALDVQSRCVTSLDLWITFNDIYDALNVPCIKAGRNAYFGVENPFKWYFAYGPADNGEPCIVLDTEYEPTTFDKINSHG